MLLRKTARRGGRGTGDPGANALVPLDALGDFFRAYVVGKGELISVLFLTGGLTCLAADVFADVADTLALVRFGLLDRANESGEVADLLLVDTGDVDDVLFLFVRRDRDALRCIEDDLVGETYGEGEFRREVISNL